MTPRTWRFHRQRSSHRHLGPYRDAARSTRIAACASARRSFRERVRVRNTRRMWEAISAIAGVVGALAGVLALREMRRARDNARAEARSSTQAPARMPAPIPAPTPLIVRETPITSAVPYSEPTFGSPEHKIRANLVPTLWTICAVLVVAGILVAVASRDRPGPVTVPTVQPSKTIDSPAPTTPVSSRQIKIALPSKSLDPRPVVRLSTPITTVGGIAFDTSSVAKTRCEESESTRPLIIAATGLAIDRVQTVHILIAAAYGDQKFEGQPIGKVVLAFGDSGSLFVTDLVLGKNIRDWSLDHLNAVTSFDPQSLSEGPIAVNPDGTRGRIDHLTIEVPSDFRQDRLTEIRIEDIRYALHDACIVVWGLSAMTV